MPTAFDDELALDRIEAELATELPAHVRAFAAAYAAGQPAPPPPAVLRRPTTIDVAHRLLPDPALRSRALDVLRLAIPIAIEDAAAVAAARSASRSWDAWKQLAAARDAVSRARFGRDHVGLVHVLHGTSPTAASPAASPPSWPPPLDGWHELSPAIDPPFVERAWRDFAIWHGARGTCRIVRAEARPRAFVVEPGREVIVVVGAIDSSAMRFAALHELGHAIAALISPHAMARVVDEAAAAYVTRLLEHEGALDLAWFTPIAAAARTRRDAISRALDAIERGASPPTELVTPPWSLWHDPGVQAAYLEAETIAERWWSELGAAPSPGVFAAALADEQRRIDRSSAAV